MALYTSAAALKSRFGDYNVKQAFATRGDSTVAMPGDATIEAKIQLAMDIIHSKLALSMTTPFSSPYPNQIVSLTQDLTLMVARRDGNAGVVPEGYQKRWDEMMQYLADIVAGIQKLDGVSLDPDRELLVNNDDGRAPSEFTADYRDDQGQLLDQTGTQYKSLRKIL